MRLRSRIIEYSGYAPNQAPVGDGRWLDASADNVWRPRRCCASELRVAIGDALKSTTGDGIDGADWGAAPYEPTPTIIEAARALYARHSVEAISRHDAGAVNLRITSVAVDEIVDRGMTRREKAIVFLTGVPSAGKTLVGLNVATQRREHVERAVRCTCRATARWWLFSEKHWHVTNWPDWGQAVARAPCCSP